MLLIRSRTDFVENTLRFLWSQWAELGVAADRSFEDRWLIDPEALLLATLHLGRHDPRLFDEVLDWCAVNGNWLSVQRLKNISGGKTFSDEQSAVLSSFADFMCSHDNAARWRSLMSARDIEPFRLFLDRNGTALPVLGAKDETFRRHCVIRSAVRPRGMSSPVPMASAPNLHFKLRALFGSGARPAIIAYLVTHDHGYPSEIARATSFSQPTVQCLMAELCISGLVSVRQAGRERLYSLDHGNWQTFLHVNGSLPIWVDWTKVFAAISSLVDAFAREDLDSLSEYLRASRLLTLAGELEPNLVDAGLPLKPKALPGLQDSEDYIESVINGIEDAVYRRQISRLGG